MINKTLTTTITASIMVFAAMAVLSVLMVMWIGWWVVGLSAALGAWVGNLHYKDKMKKEVNAWLDIQDMTKQ